MAYLNNIPTSSELISNSQSQILENFSQLDSQFGVDHYAFTVGTGFHKQVTIPTTLSVDPTPTGVGSEIYTKTVSGVAQLFFANSAGVQTLTPFTSTQDINGSLLFPNGLQFKWGTAASTGTATPILFPVAFANKCFAVFFQRQENAATPYPGSTSVDKNGFTANGIATGHNFYYFAIGN